MSSNPSDKASADRRLVEYFVIVSSVEQAHDPQKENQDAKHKQQKPISGGDISFQDWKTESSFDHDEEDAYAKYQFKPTITARYPLHDHPDNPLHDNVTFFCHPSGRIQLRTEAYMPKVSVTLRVWCGVCVYSVCSSVGWLCCMNGSLFIYFIYSLSV